MSKSLPSLELHCQNCGLLQDQHSLKRINWRYVCKDLDACGIRNSAKKLAEAPKKVRPGVVITSQLSGTNIHHNCFSALKNLATHLGFELVVAEVKWGTNKKFDNTLDYACTLEDFIIDDRHFRMATSLNLNANALSPLTGLGGIAGQNHLIVPHPVRYLTCTASPLGEASKVIVTTGTISNFNSRQTTTRVEAVTQFHSQLGCVVITDGDYPITPLAYDSVQSCFEFEGECYFSDGSKKEVLSTEYCYLPDMHLAHPRLSYQYSLSKELRKHKVHNAIGGDMFDGSSILHHEAKRLGYFAHKITIQEELAKLSDFADLVNKEITGTLFAIIGNHETFVDRFFDYNAFLSQLGSFTAKEQSLLLRAMAWSIDNMYKESSGIQYRSIFEYLLDQSDCRGKVQLANNQRVGDVLLGYHGHEYNVSKAGAAQANYKLVVGHHHAPSIWRNRTVVGYGGHVNPSYQNGLSCANAAHALINRSGKITLRIFLPH